MSIRTVQTSFTSCSDQMNYLHPHKYPPGLGMSYPSGMNSSPSLLPPARRRSGSFADSQNVVGHGLGLVTVNNRVRRRTALSPLAYHPPSNYVPVKFDPFASDDAPSQIWQHTPSLKKSPSPQSHYHISLPNFSTRSLPSTNKTRVNHQPTVPLASPKPDKNARARLVAGILLNRIYAVGKPMRRKMASSFGSKRYVPSGLSSVITVEG